jgi:nicotinamide-nucleotide amidase
MEAQNMSNDDAIEGVARTVVGELLASGKMLATAESCTGGWISKAVTDVPGSSGCFAYGMVSYSNGAKESLLGVNSVVLQEHGAVSEETVREMAKGALRLSGADLAVAVSGIAGPEGGSAEKPVGTVWIAWACRKAGNEEIDAALHRLAGERDAIRQQSVVLALQGVRQRIRPDA